MLTEGNPISALGNAVAEGRYADCLARTRAALLARVADAPGGEVLREYFERGKMLRARLVFAASISVGGDPDDVLVAAEAIELLHGAALFHDDIIDEAAERRGVRSLHARLGVGPALVLGDELLLRALAALAEARERHPADRVLGAMAELNRLARECCRGQYDELHAGPWIDEAQYLAIIGGKTAAPFVAAAVLGAVLGGGTESQVAHLRSYAQHLGLAFQITDDLLDLVGESEALGKPVGNSLAHERPLFPIIYLWGSATDSVREELRRLGQRGWPRGEVLRLLERHGTIEAVRHVQENLVENAIAALAYLPEGAGVRALRELAARVVALAFRAARPNGFAPRNARGHADP